MPTRLFAFRLPPELQVAVDKRQAETGETDAALGIAALNAMLGTDAKPREVRRPRSDETETPSEKPRSGKSGRKNK